MIEHEHLFLMVEDNDDDFEIAEYSMRKANITARLVRTVNGQEALDYLLHQGKYQNQRPEQPDLIFLDLNMPGLNGREVLRQIKASDRLKRIPVLILSTSTDERDIALSYDLGANSYIKKPMTFDEFVNSFINIHHYWFNSALLPKPQH